MTQYAIIQVSTAILGTGDTPDEALEDAMSTFGDLTAADIEPHHTAMAGECVCVPMSDDLAACPATDNWDIEGGVAVSTRGEL